MRAPRSARSSLIHDWAGELGASSPWYFPARLRDYNPYAPPASPGPPSRMIATFVAVSTLATSGFWALLGLGLWATHRNPGQVWEQGQIAILLYVVIAAPWAAASGTGLLLQRRWAWRAATGYFALTFLLVLAALVFAEPVTPMPLFVTIFAASLIALVVLLLPAVRKQLAAGAGATAPPRRDVRAKPPA